MSYQRSQLVYKGFGATVAQTVGQVGGVGSGLVTAAAAPAVATALGISASLAVPIVGAAFAGILLGVEALLNSGCGESCVVTSQWANQAEPLLRQNIDTYFHLPVRTATDRQSALRMFDAIWNKLVQLCSQPGLSTAGRNCISDRQSGSCKWKQTADSPWPGGPMMGQCWNWFAAYRDPIANDPGVQPDPTTADSISSLLAGGNSAGGSSLLPLALIGGLVILGAAL